MPSLREIRQPATGLDRIEIQTSTRFAGARRMTALLALALAAACGDVTGGTPATPGGPGPVDPVSEVASVEITPGTLQLPVQDTRSLSATARTHTGAVLTGRMMSWSSSDSSVVRVDINGNATALKVGTAVITAALDGRQGQSIIEVVTQSQANPVASVTVVGQVADMEPGESRWLEARLWSASGAVLFDREIAWSSSDSTVVRVSSTGTVTGVRGGTATITATSEGRSGSLTIVIPQWVQLELGSVFMQPLPAVVQVSADTTDRAEHSMVVTTYRQRLVSGRLWLSTVDWRYRQRFELRLYRQTVTHFTSGDAIFGPDELIQTRTLLDEGNATEFDAFTGEPRYTSTRFEGYGFLAYRLENGTRLISQRLPGEDGGSYDLRFSR
ncbi:MAG TPA: Ig-like domain-containing protein [Longimicrobium sp.]|nr:Ig-like domain-containing protein [Longimicrobium sp.]